MLNGDVLKLNVDAATVPDLTPKQQAAGDTLQLPALSFGYYMFKSVKAKACMSWWTLRYFKDSSIIIYQKWIIFSYTYITYVVFYDNEQCK